MTPTHYYGAVRLIEPREVSARTEDRLPVGQATELEPVFVRELPMRHGWDQFEAETVMMGLEDGTLAEARAA